MVHCLYAYVLAFSSVYMAIATPVNERLFMKVLNESQKQTYFQIREERMRIYYKSLFIAFIIASIYYNKVNKDICYFIAITLSLTSLFYMMAPKDQRMINSLETPEQYKALDNLRQGQKSNGITSTLIALSIWGVVSLVPKCKSKVKF